MSLQGFKFLDKINQLQRDFHKFQTENAFDVLTLWE